MALVDELSKPAICQFFAAKIEMADLTARFFMGRGKITIFGETYYGAGLPGEDGVFGQIDAIEGETGQTAPKLRLMLSGLQNSILAEAKDYLLQGAPVTVYDCVFDRSTLAPVADPDIAFYGFIDQASVEAAETATITLDCASAWDWLFSDDDIARWNDRSHQIIHPGERGFQFMLDAVRGLPWGDFDAARPVYPLTASG